MSSSATASTGRDDPARRQSEDPRPAQVVGIVGPSGSGKCTLTKLVQRLYLPERGRVLIDGIDLAVLDPAWLRRQIGVVLQENMLFNRSVRDNIALADPAHAMERVIAGGRSSPARTSSSCELPQGYDTIDRRARRACPAASASASPSPARWSPIRGS